MFANLGLAGSATLVLCISTAASAAETSSTENPDRHLLTTLTVPVVAERVLSGLSQPVAIEFLPDGTALILERDRGLMSHVDFKTGHKVNVEGMPDMLVGARGPRTPADGAGQHEPRRHHRPAA